MKKPFTMIGRVVRGDRIGRTLGFPTANIAFPQTSSVPSGIYMVLVTIGQKKTTYPGVLHVGPRKIFSETQKRAEVFLLSFRGRLYEKRLRMTLFKRLRGIRQFSSLRAMQQQIQRDVLHAKHLWIC